MADRDAGANSAALSPQGAEVRRFLAEGKSKTALDAAKALHKRTGTPATEALLVDAYCARVRALLGQRLAAEAEALAAIVRQRHPAYADRLDGLRETMAAAGAGLDDVLRPLADPSATPAQRAAAEDLIRTRLTDLAQLEQCRALPPEHALRRGAKAVRDALNAVTSGPVAEGALALPEISHRSSLAPWKTLVRAIACYYRNEDGACREHLKRVDPDSVAARAVPAIEAMLGSGDERKLSPAAAALVEGVRGDFEELSGALCCLDQMFEEGDKKQILECARRVSALAERECPRILGALRRHAAVRSVLADIYPGALSEAMGGQAKRDARFYLALARFIEASDGSPVMVCNLWEMFRRSAVKERWFPARGPEAAVVYRHMAEAAGEIEPEDLEEERQFVRGIFPGDDPEGGMLEGPGFEYLDPAWLYGQACAMDPNPESFEHWLEWAEAGGGAPAAEAAIEAWRRALPQDVRPLLRLIDQAERRNALNKALGYLRQAETIDGVNSEVRRARLRLVLQTAFRHIKQCKWRQAESDLAELEALPQARENDRPAFVAALRVVMALAKGDMVMAANLTPPVDQALGSHLAGAMAISAAGTLCGSKLGVKYKEAPGSWIEAVPRVCAMIDDLGYKMGLLEFWKPEILAELRKLRAAGPAPLEAFCRQVLRQDWKDIAYEATTAGLRLTNGNEARFLLLRSQAFPPMLFERAEDCIRAASALAKMANDRELAAEAVRQWTGSTLSGSFGGGVPAMSRRELDRVLKREREAVKSPWDGPGGYASWEDPPRRSRRRRRRVRPASFQEGLPF